MQARRLLTWTLYLTVACLSLTAAQNCGNGILEMREDCDDSNNAIGDGCSSNCTLEDGYICNNATNITTGDIYSICVMALLDLDTTDGTTLNTAIEYFYFNRVVFISDPSTTAFTVPAVNWETIHIVVLQEGPNLLQEDIDVHTREAFMQGRVSQDYSGLFLVSKRFATEFNGQNVSSITSVFDNQGLVPFPSIPESGDTLLSMLEIDIALQSIGYLANAHPGYEPRDMCIIAVDSSGNSTACATLSFIGFNIKPPEVTYNRNTTVLFIEGQASSVNIVSGTLTVSDSDHPTRYPMQEATVSIVDYTSEEEVNIPMVFPSGFSANYDATSGVLTITGEGTTDVYTSILSVITYHNNMSQPGQFSRTIQVVVSDMNHSSVPVEIQVDIMNTNDNPAVSLEGEVPIITSLMVDYMEGGDPLLIIPSVVVIDTDPMEMIIRAVVELVNPPDGNMEVISLGDAGGLSLAGNTTNNRIEVTGLAPPANYTDVLSTLAYEHMDSQPGNPTIDIRTIRLTVWDQDGASSGVAEVLLSIIPFNDPPVLQYRDNTLMATFSYTEDDPPINFGQNISVEDVDSNIASARIRLTGLLNGDNDHVTIVTDVGLPYTITVNYTSNGTTQDILLTGLAPVQQYKQVLQSLSYENLLDTNAVTNGQRVVTITVTDAGAKESNAINAAINVTNRNDGPAIDIGGGTDMDSMVNYTENGPSVAIVTSYLLDLMDEEGHTILNMSIELVATVGSLDPINATIEDGDTLFLQTPFVPYLIDPRTIITPTYIYIELNSTPGQYISALRALRYINELPEPTLFEDGMRIQREVVITISDNNHERTTVRVGVNIEPINDNAPVIIIDSDPATCTEDYRDRGETVTRLRRDIRFASKQSRKRMLSSFGESESLWAPQLSRAFANFSTPTCIDSITLIFNTDTSAPVADVQPDLDLILYFNPPEFTWTRHYGRWRDYRTLVVLFPKCVQWQGATTSGKEHPLHVIFEEGRGSCSASTPCNSGVCFANKTGCPLTGYHQVDTNSSSSTEATGAIAGHTYSRGYHFSMVLLLMVFMATLLFLALRNKDFSRSSTSSKEQQKQVFHGHPSIYTPTKEEKPVVVTIGAQTAVDISPGKEAEKPSETESMKQDATVEKPKPKQDAAQHSPPAQSPRKVSPTKKGPPKMPRPQQEDDLTGHTEEAQSSTSLPRVTDVGTLTLAKEKLGTGTEADTTQAGQEKEIHMNSHSAESGRRAISPEERMSSSEDRLPASITSSREHLSRFRKPSGDRHVSDAHTQH